MATDSDTILTGTEAERLSLFIAFFDLNPARLLGRAGTVPYRDSDRYIRLFLLGNTASAQTNLNNAQQLIELFDWNKDDLLEKSKSFPALLGYSPASMLGKLQQLSAFMGTDEKGRERLPLDRLIETAKKFPPLFSYSVTSVIEKIKAIEECCGAIPASSPFYPYPPLPSSFCPAQLSWAIKKSAPARAWQRCMSCTATI